MKRFMHLLKVEGKLSMRCPDSIIFGIFMPMGVMVLLGVLYGKDHSMIENSFGALVTVGLCATAFMGMPLTIADYRDKKILKHFFVTPIRPIVLLLVQTMLQIIFCLISAAGVYLIAKLFFSYKMNGNIVAFIGSYLFLMVSLYSLGMLIASVGKNVKLTNVLCSIVYFPMLFLSGATIPYEVFPKGLQHVADVLPLTQGIKLLKITSTGVGTTSFLLPIIVLSVCTVVGILVSLKTFRWE